MVKFHFFQTEKLAEQLSKEDPSEKVAFLYLLATELLLAFLLYYSLFLGAYINWLFYLQAVIVLMITFIGIYEAFRANGGRNGRAFLARAVCLLFPITVNVTIVSEILGWTYFFVGHTIMESAVFSDPSRPFKLIDFIWTPVFTGITFWRLNVHIGRINDSNRPNKGVNRHGDNVRTD